VSRETSTDRAVARIVGGRYQIEGLIASGGMGEVFQAHDRVLDRTVALKVLHAGLGSDPDFVERFRREATAAGRLSHPNIVQVYDWGREDDGSAYMAMELVEGQNLRDVLTGSGRLKPELAARIAGQVCLALEHARKAGLVHRDVKPENILITSDGRVKVADFGLSRTMADSRATQAGVLLGTAHYVAPEQVEGKPSDHRSDIYALGIVLYEMLTGQTPFTGDTPLMIAYQRVRENVPAPGDRIKGLPPALDEITRRATAKDPAKRFSSAGEMGEALRTSVPRSDTGEVGMLVHPTVAIPIGTQETVNLGGRRGPRLTRRGSIVVIGIIAVLAASIPILVGTLRRVEVPQVAGQAKAEAEAALRKAGFTVTTDVENSDSVLEGHVIRTEPPAGTQARKGSTISLIVSSGPVTVQVPDVRGKTYEDALRTLTDLGLKVDRRDAFSPTVKQGLVISQSKDVDVLVNVGTTITLTVSRGVEHVVVPDVKSKTEADANQILTAAGFTVTTQRADSDTVAVGVVISQTPAAGAKADKGSAITIVVSNGRPKVKVPNMNCMTRRQAADTLAGLGLQIKFQGSYPRVVDQDPQPGTELPKGSVVTAFTGPGTYC
jgi:serine/threonine-protein kinase